MALHRLLFLAAMAALSVQAQDVKKPAEPRLASAYPMTGSVGHTSRIVVRGTAIAAAGSVEISGDGVVGRIIGAKPDEADPIAPADAVELELDVAANAGTGPHLLRLITPRGLSNAVSFRVAEGPVTHEEDTTDAIRAFPVLINGRIAKPGEVDAYWINVAAGQTLTFTVVSGHGSFDPSISISEPSGSWFDSTRLNRIAFNDEPLHFPGLSSNAFLTHTFPKAGRFCVNVAAFGGQGGPNFSYELQIRAGSIPPPALHPVSKSTWDERQFTRDVSTSWQQHLVSRSGGAQTIGRPELYHAVSDSAAQLPVMKAPAIVQGRLTRPAETHFIRLRIEQPQDLAFEIETPEATMPRFNPVLRLLDATGAEVLTNVHTKLNNNGLYMMKMIQPKVTVSFPNPGDYTLQIRDITTDCSGPDFAYRVLVRPQIAHLGRVLVTDESWNVPAGSSKAFTVTMEREEGFAAPISFLIDGLPAGLTVTTAVPLPEEKPLLFNGGKIERYTPKTHTAVIVITAAPEAVPSKHPVSVRLRAQPFVNGKIGGTIPIQEIPLFVLPRSAT